MDKLRTQLLTLVEELREPLNTSLGSTEFTNGINVANYALAERLENLLKENDSDE